MRECERKERQERGGERERKEIYRRAKAYPAVACARDKDRAKWLFLWSIGGRPYKISSEWRSLFTGRRPTRDSVVGSLSLALSLSRPRTLIVVLSCLLSLPDFRSRSTSSRPVAEREREKERKRDGEERASLPRERARMCSQCARRARSVFTGLVLLSRLVSTRLASPSSYLTTPRSTSPHLASPHSTP